MDLNIENNKNIPNSNLGNEIKNSIKSTCLFSIDRFEGDVAVCENKTTHEIINIKRELLPENCKEGDIIKFANGVYIIDELENQKAKQEIKQMVNNLFKKQ